MPSISTMLRSLGNDGALRNVRAVLDERQREDWLVAGLVHRLDGVDGNPAVTPALAERTAA